MPMFLDIHKVPESVTSEDVAQAHLADLKLQDNYGVDYVRYWFNQAHSRIYCLCTAPDEQTARRVHQEAHGLVAEKIISVDPDLVEEFLGMAVDHVDGAVRMPNSNELDSGLRTILFTDIVGSTDLTQRLGDQAALAMLDEHDAIVRKSISMEGGREVKHTGDGIMAVFNSAAAAMRCASHVQQALAARNASKPSWPLNVRIGAAVGEPVERNNDIFGSTVQLAARLCAAAEPGEVLVASNLADACSSAGIPFDALEQSLTLKGFDQPQKVRRVRWPMTH